MQEFLQIALGFPTVVYSVLLGVALLLSAVVTIGGGGAFELDLDVGGVDEAGAGFLQFLTSLGVGRVPMSIFLTFFVFSGWAITYLMVHFSAIYLDGGPLVGWGILLLATLAAFPVTALLTAPLGLLFEGVSGVDDGEALIGTVCEVSTSAVDARFGQARCFSEGSELTLSIRCAHKNNLGRGDKALIIGFDSEDNCYEVEPFDEMLARPSGQQEVVLDEIDFEGLEEAAERYEEEKAKAKRG